MSFDENPIVDQDEWAAEWESLQEGLHDDPYDAVAELTDFIDRLLQDQQLPLDDPVAAMGIERELTAELENLHDIADRTRRGEDVPPADIAGAIEGARLIWADRQNPSAKGDAEPLEEIAAEELILEADAADIGETRERLE